MINRFFLEKISNYFPFSFTDDQLKALDHISRFLFSGIDDQLFLLKGYAGTGKSSLVGSLVKTLTAFGQRCVLLAPTGRAAKVFSGYASHAAFTIHKKIYRQERFGEGTPSFSLSDNLHKQTLFIVDEASMIHNDSGGRMLFGSGHLLDDLIEYVYGGENCRMMLIGDTAQLPPVKETFSPALDVDLLSSYSLEVMEFTLTEIVRQSESSGILHNATMLRNALISGNTAQYPKLRVQGFADVKLITGMELIDAIGDGYRQDGIEETIVITRSNRRVNAYNKGIRNQILYREEELSSGDILMITKNNYFQAAGYEQLDYLANGEFVEVLRVRGEETMYGFRFCNALLYHPDYEIEFEAKILLDVLHTEVPGLSREQQDLLFTAVMEDYAEITQKRKRYRKVKENPYFNALQVKYGECGNLSQSAGRGVEKCIYLCGLFTATPYG